MLQKMKKAYIHKVHMIKLFEGGFNGALKYLVGRELTKNMVEIM